MVETSTVWVRLELMVAREHEDRVTLGLLELGVPGWELVEQEVSYTRIRLWALPEDSSAIAGSLEAIAGSPVYVSAQEVVGDWMEAWRPLHVGRFVIRTIGAPLSAADVSPGSLEINLAPALAFGGGEHASTRLCLKELPRLVIPGRPVLDVGSGSGVLSVAAAQLGAHPVSSVDIDPTARRATQRAAEASGVALQVYDQVNNVSGRFRTILANILAPELIALAEPLLERLEPEGQILLSGIRSGHEAFVSQAFSPLSVLAKTEEEGWSAIVLG